MEGHSLDRHLFNWVILMLDVLAQKNHSQTVLKTIPQEHPLVTLPPLLVSGAMRSPSVRLHYLSHHAVQEPVMSVAVTVI